MWQPVFIFICHNPLPVRGLRLGMVGVLALVRFDGRIIEVEPDTIVSSQRSGEGLQLGLNDMVFNAQFGGGDAHG